MNWFSTGGRAIELGLALDPLGKVAGFAVSAVAVIATIYAASYMSDDRRRPRFFVLWTLFIGSMLLLVVAADAITLFIAWELVGICSYLLIGFWFEKDGVPAKASQALIITRIGDVALLGGLLLLIASVGTSRIDALLQRGNSSTLPIVLILIGAAAKAAQVPFQGWLPDAMVGPTPVSALLHSATMVAAGVFLVVRFYPLFVVSTGVLHLVGWMGAVSSLVAGLAALVEQDLKRTLAYSTISQLGLMFVGLGAVGLAAAMVLFVAHAFYKSTLFLGAGVVDRVVGGTEYDKAGDLWLRQRVLAIAFGVAAATLAGLPVTFAAPAKDPILVAAATADRLLYLTVLASSFLTAVYATRMFLLVFVAPQRGENRQDAPPLMLWTTVFGSVSVLFASAMKTPIAHLLGFVLPERVLVTGLAIGIAGAGVVTAAMLHVRSNGAIVWPLLERAEPVLSGEFGVKQLYSAVTVACLRSAGALAKFDARVFDGSADFAARAVGHAVRGVSRVDRAVFDRAANATADAVLKVIRQAARFDLRSLEESVLRAAESILVASNRLRKIQTGRIENYLLSIFLWSLVIVAAATVLAWNVAR